MRAYAAVLDMPLSDRQYMLHEDDVRRIFNRAAATYDEAAVLQLEVGKRLLERLDYLRIEPVRVVDLGTGTGSALDALHRRYPAAQIIGIDIAEGMLRRARQCEGSLPRLLAAADASALPLADHSVDLVYSNLMLPWCPQPERVWAEIERVLHPGGALLCTTLGPDTLMELRTALAILDGAVVHVHAFIDMHDIGDALIRHRIAEPVVDAERLRVDYASLGDLIDDLRQTGSSNIATGRRRGLGRCLTLAALAQHYPGADRNGCVSATVEVVYGHGWAAPERIPETVRPEVFVPLAALGGRKPET